MKKIIIAAIVIIVLLGIGIGVYMAMNANTHNLAGSLNSAKQGIIVQEKPEDIIKKLDMAYWDAVKFNDMAAAFEFFQPSDQKLISKADYIKKENADTGLQITDVKIVDIRLDSPTTALVRITVTNASGSYNGTDNYTLVNGKWYRVMSEENKQFLGIGQ